MGAWGRPQACTPKVAKDLVLKTRGPRRERDVRAARTGGGENKKATPPTHYSGQGEHCYCYCYGASQVSARPGLAGPH